MHAFGWNQSDVARICEVSKNTVGRWLHDGKSPFDPALLLLARASGVPADYLIDPGQAEPPGPPVSHDEQFLLRAYRQLGISAEVAVMRLGRTENEKSGPVTLIAERDRTALENAANGSSVERDRNHKPTDAKGTPRRRL